MISQVKTVQAWIDESILTVCQQMRLVIFTKPINLNAYPLLLKGAATKPFDMTQKTERSGPFAGYILANETSRNTTVVQTTMGLNRVVTDEQGFPMTSDLDILLMGYQGKKCDALIKSQQWGNIATYELEAAQAINALFKKRVLKGSPTCSHDMRLISHGPASRVGSTKQDHIHFPMVAYTPDEKLTIGHFTDRNKSLIALKKILKELSKTYTLEPHKNWRL